MHLCCITADAAASLSFPLLLPFIACAVTSSLPVQLGYHSCTAACAVVHLPKCTVSYALAGASLVTHLLSWGYMVAVSEIE